MYLPAALAADPGIWVNGITESINDVTLGAALSGTVGSRPFKEGDFVKKTDIILNLDKRLEELEVTRKKFQMDLQKTELDSTRKLFEKNAISISREEMDKKNSEYDVARVEYDLAKEQLRKRSVEAPFDGFIAQYFLNVGEACQAQQPLVRLVDTRRCYFVTNVEAKTGYGLKPGQTVKLEIDAGTSPASFAGLVFFVSPVVDPASGLMRVKVIFENLEARIRPGVAGRMFLEERSNVN